MKYRFPFDQRLIASRAIEGTQQVLLAAIVTVAIFRLGNMQLDGLLTFAGGFSALLFGFASLMFNRARAYAAGPIQRRSLVVAELALRSTLSFVLGAGVTALFFAVLAHSSYVPTSPSRYPTQIGPIICTFVPLPFIAHSFFTLTKATRLLVHGLFMPVRPKLFARR